MVYKMKTPTVTLITVSRGHDQISMSVHYTHQCIAAIADYTHVHHVVQDIRTYHTLLLLLIVPQL